MHHQCDSVRSAISDLNTEELRRLILDENHEAANSNPSPEEEEREGKPSLFHDLLDTLTRNESSHLETVPFPDERLRCSSPAHNWNKSIDDNVTWPVSSLLQEGNEGCEGLEENVQVPPWKWLRHLPEKNADHKKRHDIAFLLSEFGEDVNAVDADGVTPLHRAVVGRDAFLCDALLQCGADPNVTIEGFPVIAHAANLCLIEENLQVAQTEEEEDTDEEVGEERVLEEKEEADKLHFVPSRIVFEVCKFYWPGLWNAVQWQSIEKVRRLLNCWCRVDITRDGESLKSLALSTGNEAIISLILNIQPTMDIIHKCFAGDIEGVKASLDCSSQLRINLNLKKMSEKGAPLLYFMIIAGHTRIIRVLTEAGASPFVTMLDEEEDAREIPVLFLALKSETSPEILEILIPENSKKSLFFLDRVRYRGKSLLRMAVDQDVCDRGILRILDMGGPSLLTERDERGLTPLDLLLQKGRLDLASKINNLVQEWFSQSKSFQEWCRVLVLRRFQPLEDDTLFLSKLNDERFHREAIKCQHFIDQLYEAVENSDQREFEELCNGFESECFFVVDLLFLGMTKDNVLPLLHWIVIRREQKMLAFTLDLYFTSLNTQQDFLSRNLGLDNIRDLWDRTALHYAYAVKGGGKIVKLLSNAGATDHTLDMYYREPLDFKDARGSKAMENLLNNLRNKNTVQLNQEEPWQPKILLRHQEYQRKRRFKERMKKHPEHSHHCHSHLTQSHSYYDFNYRNTNSNQASDIRRSASCIMGQKGGVCPNLSDSLIAPHCPDSTRGFKSAFGNKNIRNSIRQDFYLTPDSQLVAERYNQDFISDKKLTFGEDSESLDESKDTKFCNLM